MANDHVTGVAGGVRDGTAEYRTDGCTRRPRHRSCPLRRRVTAASACSDAIRRSGGSARRPDPRRRTGTTRAGHGRGIGNLSGIPHRPTSCPRCDTRHRSDTPRTETAHRDGAADIGTPRPPALTDQLVVRVPERFRRAGRAERLGVRSVDPDHRSGPGRAGRGSHPPARSGARSRPGRRPRSRRRTRGGQRRTRPGETHRYPPNQYRQTRSEARPNSDVRKASVSGGQPRCRRRDGPAAGAGSVLRWSPARSARGSRRSPGRRSRPARTGVPQSRFARRRWPGTSGSAAATDPAAA